ncbi:MAG: DUF4856 domain-containing protein [Cytophagaceae bacterium]|jgi:hypothetical protein|nr:DUF4856 domain-containing protein [Cytophagaceae bacterium]
MFTKIKIVGCMALVALAISCKEGEIGPPPVPSYSFPSTYNFADTTSGFAKGDTVFLMLSELNGKMNAVKTVGTTLDDVSMKNMLTGSGFTNVALTNASFDLEDLITTSTDVTVPGISLSGLDVLNIAIDSLKLSANPSATGAAPVTGTIGTAGVVETVPVPPATSGSKYVINKYGMEYQQLVDKGQMGSLIYYQLTNKLMDVSSTGSGVSQADKIKNWDFAFKLVGIPSTYSSLLNSGLTNPQIRSRMRYFGAYAFDRKNDSKLPNAIGTIYNAFIAGRVAINNNDQALLDIQKAIIQQELEKVWAATMVKYIDDANTTDQAKRNHALSELIAFIKGFQYSAYPARVSNATLNNWLSVFDHPNFATQGYNFYEVTQIELNTLRTNINTTFGFTF